MNQKNKDRVTKTNIMRVRQIIPQILSTVEADLSLLEITLKVTKLIQKTTLRKITWTQYFAKSHSVHTSHSAYVATSTESHGVKIDGFLYPNFM